MSNVSQINSRQQIREQASLWISRLDRELSEEEKDALGMWLEQSPKHHQELLDMARYWDDLTVLNQLSTLFPLEQSLNSKRQFGKLAIAASLMFCTIFSSLFLLTNDFFPSLNQHAKANNQILQTLVGEQANFMLPDGTKVHLNTNSEVTLAFSSNHRKLTLVKGEASFDVAKDTSRPFTVIVGSQAFTALGTVFNVQKNDDKAMELVVTEGRVLVASAQQSLAQITQVMTTPEQAKASATIVTSGQKALIARDEATPIAEIPLEQLQRDLAWQQGMLIFEGEPLDLALIEVSRYTATKFDIIDPQLSQLKVAGYFKAGDIDGLLASLNSNFNIVTNRNEDDIIELSAAN